jgi:hypothetical protein
MYHRHKLLDLTDLAALTMTTEIKNKSTHHSTKDNLPQIIAVCFNQIFLNIHRSPLISCGTDTISIKFQHRYLEVSNHGIIAATL